MLIKAEQKYIRISPRKLRVVADMVRKISSPEEAAELLEVVNKRSAKALRKVFLQAIANATNNFSLAKDSLKVHELQIAEGPIYKRLRPVARGRVHPIQKRTSHIRLILEATEKSTRTTAKDKKGGKSPVNRRQTQG